MKKKILVSIFLVLLGLTVSSPVFALSGFVPKQIWYSKDSLLEGDTVEVHTAVWNGEANSVLVKVEFYDNDIVLGTREVTLKPNELKDVFVLWKITAGEHVISAKIVSSVVILDDGKKSVSLRYTETTSDTQEVKAKKKEVEKMTNDIVSATKDILPEGVNETISSSYVTVDTFRSETATKLEDSKEEAKKEVESIEKEKEKKSSGDLNYKKGSVEEVIKKPLAYIKLFLLSVLSFIFSNKIVFYGLVVFVLYYILRLIYRSIKNR